MSATNILPFGPDAVAEAARLILAGEPVAVPTETVYGLAADATNAEAVARIYAAKGRPSFNPLIVHVSGVDQAQQFGASFSPTARALADSFWPGPLTLVLPYRPHWLQPRHRRLADAVRAGLPTVAMRMPRHEVLQALIRATGRPLAAPSANASGTISSTRPDHVLTTLVGRIPLIIDGGETTHGLESTILKVEGDSIRVLRPGPVTDGDLIGFKFSQAEAPALVEAPGQTDKHYAPTKPLRLDAAQAQPNEFLIGFGEIAGDASLSPAGDLEEAGALLFHLLHQADASSKAAIAVAPIPEEGLGLAIRDRLRRAAYREGA